MQLVPNTSYLPLLPQSLPMLQHGSFPQDAAFPKLIQCVIPIHCSSSRTAPAWVCTFRNRLFQSGSPTDGSSHQTSCSCGLQLWPVVCFCKGSPWAPSGLTYLLHHGLLSEHEDLLHRGTTWAAGGRPAPPRDSPQAPGEQLQFSLLLMSAELFLSTFSYLPLPAAVFPFLK